MAFEESGQESFDSLYQEIVEELQLAQRTLKEVNLMLEQSQVELKKLTQRNASITGHLQQVQTQFDSIPRSDIRMAYNAALDAQQRLLVMRSQLDKLQSDQIHLKKQVNILEKMTHLMESGNAKAGGSGSRNSEAVLEMVIDAQESERQHLSRQMHDGPAQALSNFIVQTEIATRLFDSDPNKAKEELNNLKSSAMGTFQKVRDFIFDLRPMMLDDLGLLPTIRRYVQTVKEQTGAEFNLNIHGSEQRLESYLEVMIFRGLQELIRNAIQHNQENPVKLQIDIQLVMEENFVKVSVSDNGRGFPSEASLKDIGIGLKVIKERAEMSGGFLEIDSAPGQGSNVSFQIPFIETGLRKQVVDAA